MRIITVILIISYACLGEATLKHLKAKLKLSPFTEPEARYRYVTSPFVIPEPVPLLYSTPVSVFRSHTSTYGAVPHHTPSYAVYKSPVYPAPAVHSSVVTVPAVIYEEPPVIHYEEPVTLSIEASAFNEGRYPAYGAVWHK